MAIYYFNHQGNALLHGYVWQSNQSSMWNVVQMYQLPEVRIDRDQYPALCSCEFQQSPIPWIGAKIPGVHNVHVHHCEATLQDGDRRTGLRGISRASN